MYFSFYAQFDQINIKYSDSTFSQGSNLPYLRQFDYTMTHRMGENAFMEDFLRWTMNNVYIMRMKIVTEYISVADPAVGDPATATPSKNLLKIIL